MQPPSHPGERLAQAECDVGQRQPPGVDEERGPVARRQRGDRALDLSHRQIRAGGVASLALADSTPLQGGVPIRVDGKVVGAVGVSGDTPQFDEAIAIAAASAFK